MLSKELYYYKIIVIEQAMNKPSVIAGEKNKKWRGKHHPLYMKK